MSLDRVKMETSASQFGFWMEFLEWETNAFDKTCYYLAQIAAEIRRPNVRKGAVVKIEDFIMKFMHKKVVESAPEDIQTKTNKVKQFFFGLTGLTNKSKKRKKR